MVYFTATILQFGEKGEKSGWTHIEVPAEIAQELKPGNKKAFRVRGRLDAYRFEGISLVPMGGGNFIMPLNLTVRKGIGKRKGAMVQVQLDVDNKPVRPPPAFVECMSDEPTAIANFNKLPMSHQNYFIKWIDTAKTEPTKTKRIALAVTSLSKGLGFGEMIRMNKKKISDLD